MCDFWYQTAFFARAAEICFYPRRSDSLELTAGDSLRDPAVESEHFRQTTKRISAGHWRQEHIIFCTPYNFVKY